jgi:hypothetical protein
MTTPAPDLQNVVELWLCALRLLPSDPRALGALLRSNVPQPRGIRYLIGELFDPGQPPLMDVQVTTKRTKVLAKAINKLNASRENSYRTAGQRQSSQDAAEDIAEYHGISSRQVYAWLSEDMPGQFKARLREFTEEIFFQNFSDDAERTTHNDQSADDLVLGAMSMTG